MVLIYDILTHVAILLSILLVTGQLVLGKDWFCCSSIGGKWTCSGAGLMFILSPSTDIRPTSSGRLFN